MQLETVVFSAFWIGKILLLERDYCGQYWKNFGAAKWMIIDWEYFQTLYDESLRWNAVENDSLNFDYNGKQKNQ